MKVDGGLAMDPGGAVASAKDAEASGYAGAWTAETGHDPFLSLLLAAEHTSTLELGTAIAVAFARNPMTLATTANDVNTYSHGLLLLGLGSQIKAHVTKRFSMEWSHPAARMREFIFAMRAIWDCWHNGTQLDFRGDFYQHTLMTPFFNPGSSEYGAPRVFLAGVGPLMTEVAGEAADGFICHGFTTERYLREVTVPALERGRAKAGKTLDGYEISGPFFVVTGWDEAQVKAAEAGTKRQIAFYGSTPAYRGVLELHGWGELQTELNALSKQGRWKEMGDLIDDDILRTFAVVAEPDKVAAELLARYGDVATRLSFYTPFATAPEQWLPIVDALRAA
jgi:probable F420-dependent oxidoreductase